MIKVENLTKKFGDFAALDNLSMHVEKGAMLGITAALGFAPYNLWWLTLLSVGGAYWLATSEENISFGRAWVRAIPFGVFYAITMFCDI